ncbi:MAG TPA: hypothetical protein VFA29_12535 [Candidatus Baltobacteraceae bacterium]|nr:hypothetical protein [Candidatus Baltobacteraceae bacterium]
MPRPRHVLFSLLAVVLALESGWLLLPHRAAAQQQSCGETQFSSNGVTYRVVFAKNGAVQQYLLQASSHNQEHDHDALLAAEAKYGPEAINAPPVKIISFKQGDGGMMIPDKAIDSCGRVTHFH